MIELTPLDVRNKKEDLDRAWRGYSRVQVESFLDLAAERLEELVTEKKRLEERVERLEEELSRFREREAALNEALLTAQELREESRAQAEREAALTVREAESRAEEIEREARRSLEAAQERLDRLRGRRARFLRSFRSLLEGYLAEVEAEQDRLRSVRSEEEVGSERPSSSVERGEPAGPTRGDGADEESE